jgi:hypothetical protein
MQKNVQSEALGHPKPAAKGEDGEHSYTNEMLHHRSHPEACIEFLHQDSTNVHRIQVPLTDKSGVDPHPTH